RAAPRARALSGEEDRLRGLCYLRARCPTRAHRRARLNTSDLSPGPIPMPASTTVHLALTVLVGRVIPAESVHDRRSAGPAGRAGAGVGVGNSRPAARVISERETEGGGIVKSKALLGLCTAGAVALGVYLGGAVSAQNNQPSGNPKAIQRT